MKRQISDRDLGFLKTAVDIAKEGIPKGGGPFGAVIVRDGKIIAEAYNEVVYSADPTAHAEILAIRKASEILETHILDGCVMYASCEPCPMCLGAIYWSGIKEVFYAAGREDAAKAGFSDSEFYTDISKDPSERVISFIKVDRVKGSEPFRLWEKYEKKVPY